MNFVLSLYHFNLITFPSIFIICIRITIEKKVFFWNVLTGRWLEATILSLSDIYIQSISS